MAGARKLAPPFNHNEDKMSKVKPARYNYADDNDSPTVNIKLDKNGDAIMHKPDDLVLVMRMDESVFSAKQHDPETDTIYEFTDTIPSVIECPYKFAKRLIKSAPDIFEIYKGDTQPKFSKFNDEELVAELRRRGWGGMRKAIKK